VRARACVRTLYIYIVICMYVYIYVYICMNVCVCVCIYIYIFVCMYIHTYIYISCLQIKMHARIQARTVHTHHTRADRQATNTIYARVIEEHLRPKKKNSGEHLNICGLQYWRSNN
jgi:ABC-type bacteriocin/lantibiotic exporter with double-glycine peptidase domain